MPLFQGVSRDHLKLFKDDGRPDGEKIVKFLDYKRNDVSLATNLPLKSIHYDNKIPHELEKRFKEWAVLLNLVAGFMSDPKKTTLWFDIPNPLLGGISPKEMIKFGRFKKLRDVIQNALEENNRQ